MQSKCSFLANSGKIDAGEDLGVGGDVAIGAEQALSCSMVVMGVECSIAYFDHFNGFSPCYNFPG